MALSDIYPLLIPVLTGNTSNPQFIISASGCAWGTTNYWKAFNGTNKHNEDCWHGQYHGTKFLQVSFDRKYILAGLFFWQRSDTSYPSAGQTIYVYSSNDGTTWNEITTFPSPSANVKIEVEFPSFVICKYIKVVYYGQGYFTCGELNFYHAQIKTLLKVDNDYYSIKNEYYDTTNKKYTPLTSLDFETQNFSLLELIQKISIGNETFKPIDKFDEFSFITEIENPLKLLGCKTKSELIVPNNHVDVSVAHSINYFKLLANKNGTGQVKFTFSIDNGTTWNSYNSSSKKVLPLDITIPLKPYHLLSDEQKTLWEEAKTKIHTNGISYEKLASIDFNSIMKDSDKIRFAYVISKEDYDDVAELDRLDFGFDAKGVMRKMKNSEFEVYSCVNEIVVTPNVSTDILQTHILI